MKKFYADCQGIYLFELMIALGIIGIIMTLCLPIYSAHFVAARRFEAASALTQLAYAMEKYHSKHHTYQDVTFKALSFPEYVGKHHYQLIIYSVTDIDYLLLAKPLGDQAKNDSLCASLTLNALDEKGVTGTGKVMDCW